MSYVEDAAVVNSDAERAVCEKVGQNVCGLMNPDPNVMPYLSTEVANCSHRINPDDLVDDVVDHTLSETKTANWCRTARSLIPLHISGVGNCLAAACAMTLWGCSLPANLLRRLIYVTLVEFGSLRYLNRWRRQQCTDGGTDTSLQCGNDGWDQVVRRAQPQQHDASLLCYSDTLSLSDAIQVFVLANILRRPIIVLCCISPTTSDTSLSSSQPCSEDIGGIYMPLLWSADECVRYPLVLAHVNGKFRPLVGGDGTADLQSALDIVPLVKAQLEPLPVWFLLNDEECEVYSLMQRYMNVTEVNLCQADSINMVLGARLKYQKLEETASTSATRTTVTLPPAAVHFQDALPTETSISHSPETRPAEGVSIGSSHCQAQSAVELSLTTSPCREPLCTNFASSFVYPYCYEHIDRRIVENTAAQRQQQMTSAPPDTSLMSVHCNQAGCPNMCSVFVYPYCYEHIETKISEHRGTAEQSSKEYLMSISPEDCIYPGCQNRASVNTYPVCYQHLDYFSQHRSPPQHEPIQPLAAAATATEERAVEAELQQSRPLIYDKMMIDLEKRTKGTAAKCRSVDCDNYGNSRCGGFCHECYQMRQIARHF